MGTKKGGACCEGTTDNVSTARGNPFVFDQGKVNDYKIFNGLLWSNQKTILKDIMFLSSVVPLETHPGNGGGIFLKMEYDAPRVYLSAEEEENLLLRLIDSVCVKEKRILINVINKFSMPVKK